MSFPLTEKIEVNGDGRHPLYQQLTQTADAEGHTGDIRWNFEKFLIGRDGEIIARFSPMVDPEADEIVERDREGTGRLSARPRRFARGRARHNRRGDRSRCPTDCIVA